MSESVSEKDTKRAIWLDSPENVMKQVSKLKARVGCRGIAEFPHDNIFC